MKSFISLIITLAAATATQAKVVDFNMPGTILSFEQDLENVSGGKKSSLTLSEEHSKLGEKSLKWSWKKAGEQLTVKGTIPYMDENPNPKETSVSTFVFWVYSPAELSGNLKFTFYKGEKECCHFDYGLGFKGWRGAWVAFDRDMTGTPEEGMDRIVITAPEQIKKGTLFFDGIIKSSFQDVRHHTADWQAPYINANTSIHWLILNKSWNNRLDIPVEGKITDKQQKDLQNIEEKFIRLVSSSKKRWDYEKISSTFGSYNLRENRDGTINGKPIFFTRYGETFINLGIKDASKQFKNNGQLLRTLNDNMFQIALAWKDETDPEKKNELAEMYVILTRHLLDQGFAAGSALGTLHHLGYSMRNFYTGPVIMKSVLRNAGLLEQIQQAAEWFSGVGEVKTAPQTPGMDIDSFNTSLMGRVASVLLLDDTPYKVAYMKAISRWIDNGFKYAEGTRPCFKRDGTVFHHRKAYPAYATGGFDGAVYSVWMLSNTGFAISEESHTILKEALLAMRFYCNKKSFPLAMSGRHPDGKGELIQEQYALLADAGSPDGAENIDSDLAAAYMRLAERQTGLMKKFRNAGIEAEFAPEGNRTFGYNCSMSHRRDNWLVTFAGHSRYLWSSEIYNGANHYGRYLTHGSMQILADPKDNVSSSGSGYQVDGWDWCHIPGTTAAAIPMEKMKANVMNVDKYSGYEEMLLSDEWFAGGVSHRGMDGVFGMKLHEHDKYNGSLRANKSFFAFGNRIVALGSDIENALENSEVHTTLFQNSLNEDFKECSMTLDGKSNIIYDRFGNAYLVRNAQVHLTKGIQHSLHEETDAPTQAPFEKAWINHGGITQDGRYEYLTVIHPEKGQAEEYGHISPYRVVRCDKSAHIVIDKESGTTGMVLFDGLEKGYDKLIIESTPCIAMYSMGCNGLILSVCNPDLALYKGKSDEILDTNGKRIERSVYSRKWIDNPCGDTSVTMTLCGKWKITDYGNFAVDLAYDSKGNTKLTFHTKEARTEEIELIAIN